MFSDDVKTEDVASATECTGIAPALTDAAGDADSRRLYAVTAARRKGKHKKKT